MDVHENGDSFLCITFNLIPSHLSKTCMLLSHRWSDKDFYDVSLFIASYILGIILLSDLFTCSVIEAANDSILDPDSLVYIHVVTLIKIKHICFDGYLDSSRKNFR